MHNIEKSIGLNLSEIHENFMSNFNKHILSNFSHSQILLIILTLYICYCIYISIDWHKVFFRGHKVIPDGDPVVLERAEAELRNELHTETSTYKINGFPEESKTNEWVMDLLKEMKKNDKIDSYFKSEEEINSYGEKVARISNGKYYKSNQLHFSIFPGVCQCESEVCQMLVHLFKGGDEECGIIDISDDDNLRNTVLSHRESARDSKPKPNLIAPNTFNSSLKNICDMLDVELRIFQVNQDCTVKADQFYDLIDSNTILL